MTKVISVISLLIFFAKTSWGQDKIQLTNLESKNILTALFEAKSFKSGNEIEWKNEGLWKPNTYERVNMPISDDGFCHTAVDTILYTSTFGNKQAIVIFKSRAYSGELPSSCHGCPVMLSIATFEKKDNIWELNQFKKRFKFDGFYGETQGHFEIINLGDGLNCLYHRAEIDGGQGYFSGYGYFYSLDYFNDFQQVFQFKHYDSAGVTDDNTFTENKELKLIKTDNFYKIELTTKRDNKGILKT